MKVLMESTHQSPSIIQSAVCNYSDAEEDLPTSPRLWRQVNVILCIWIYLRGSGSLV